MSFHLIEKLTQLSRICAKGPKEIYVDNKSSIPLAKKPVFHDRSKHIDTRYHFIREHVNKSDVELVYCKSQDQVIDIYETIEA